MTDVTDRLYDRQSTLNINRSQRVMVVGCGGIGAWVGYFLGLAGVEELDLFDGDKVEEHNLNRLPFTSEDIGDPKSWALAKLLRRARPDVTVRSYAHFDPEWHKKNVEAADWMVVSTDSLASRRMCHKAAMAANVRYIECGAEGHGMTVTGSPAEWSNELENNPGYQSVPVFVGPCTMAASIAVYYVLMGTTPDVTHRMTWGTTGIESGPDYLTTVGDVLYSRAGV